MKDQFPFVVVVDIQPSFHSGCGLLLPDVIEKLNSTEQQIIFFYAGRQICSDSRYDVQAYLLENGLNEDTLERIRFIEKSYGFFRPWMDKGVSEDIIIKAIQVMKEEQINDSTEFTKQHWQRILPANYHDPRIDEPFFYHDFNEKIFNLPAVNGFELIGGGRYECLQEIELFLKALGKDLEVNERLCYGTAVHEHKSNWNSTKTKKHKR